MEDADVCSGHDDGPKSVLLKVAGENAAYRQQKENPGDYSKSCWFDKPTADAFASDHAVADP